MDLRTLLGSFQQSPSQHSLGALAQPGRLAPHAGFPDTASLQGALQRDYARRAAMPSFTPAHPSQSSPNPAPGGLPQPSSPVGPPATAPAPGITIPQAGGPGFYGGPSPGFQGFANLNPGDPGGGVGGFSGSDSSGGASPGGGGGGAAGGGGGIGGISGPSTGPGGFSGPGSEDPGGTFAPDPGLATVSFAGEGNDEGPANANPPGGGGISLNDSPGWGGNIGGTNAVGVAGAGMNSETAAVAAAIADAIADIGGFGGVSFSGDGDSSNPGGESGDGDGGDGVSDSGGSGDF